jgi:hypothetical protein
MAPRKNRLDLIGNRFNAALALCATGLVAAMSFRDAFSGAPPKTEWLISPEPLSLPIWVVAAANTAFYLYLMWIFMMFYRNAQREERIVIGGWFIVGMLIPLPHLVSARGAVTIQWIKAAGMAAAFIAAAYILVKSPPSTGGVGGMQKRRILLVLLILLACFTVGALMYFVPR